MSERRRGLRVGTLLSRYPVARRLLQSAALTSGLTWCVDQTVVTALGELTKTLLDRETKLDTIADKAAAGLFKAAPRSGLMKAADPADRRAPGNTGYRWADSISAPVQMDGRMRIFDVNTQRTSLGPHVAVLTGHELDRVESGLMQAINDRHYKQNLERFRPDIRPRPNGTFEEVLQLPVQPGGQSRPQIQSLEQSAKDLGVKLNVTSKTIDKFYARVATRLNRLEQLTRVAVNETLQRLDRPGEFENPDEDQRRLLELIADVAVQMKLTLTTELCSAIGMAFRHKDAVDPVNPFNNLNVLQQQDQAQSKEAKDVRQHIRTNFPQVSLRDLSNSADKSQTDPAEARRARQRLKKQRRKRKRGETTPAAGSGADQSGGGRGGGRHVEVRGRGRGRGGGRGRGRGQSRKTNPSQNPGGSPDDQDVGGYESV